MITDPLEQLSEALADRLAAASPFVVAIRTGRRDYSGILWRDDVVVTSEQILPDTTDFTILRAGTNVAARLAGRDGGTNVAALRLSQGLGGLTATSRGYPARRLPGPHRRCRTRTVRRPGASAWSTPPARPGTARQAAASISLLRLDFRLAADEGGPVLTLGNRLIGMSTAGPRRRALVIPAATIDRVLGPLLTEGRVPRGWLGVGLQHVAVPERMRDAAGRDAGMMVVGLAPGSPAEQAGVLPGDIILEVDGRQTGRARGLATSLLPDRIGQPATLKLIRAGEVRMVTVTIGARPAKA